MKHWKIEYRYMILHETSGWEIVSVTQYHAIRNRIINNSVIYKFIKAGAKIQILKPVT